MVCVHNTDMAGLISNENYALWVAMHGTASYELKLLDCPLFSGLLTSVHKPDSASASNPTEMQRTLIALWSAIVPSSPRIIEDACRLMRWLYRS